MRALIVILGLLLVAVSVAWFVSDDLPARVREALEARGIVAGPAPAASRSRSLNTGSSWETIKFGLDVANAVIGGVGIVLALQGRRQKQRQTAA